MNRHVFIQTYGCQMNEHDTQRMLAQLADLGYAPADSPEHADLVLVNTCSVRHNPENKVYSFLGRLRPLKRRNPRMVVGVCGCVAQQEGERILEREPLVDMVFGPDHIFRLAELLGEVEGGARVCATSWMPRQGRIQNFIPEEWVERGHVDGVKAYIAITKGCNNMCTFCIVPHTRGREVSREPESILREASSLIERGAREIWLLGQNVNSYRGPDGYRFIKLLDDLSRLPVARIRFTSPHPKDWNADLTDLMAERPNICNHLHLPFQAGSDRILRAMRRNHTLEEYLAKIRYLRERIPEVEITTDLIVGFPGETEEDFQRTLYCLETVRFSQVFSFKYSPRPGTPAAELPDDVPAEIKEERLARVIALQEKINEEAQQSLIGTVQQVLLDGAHPRRRGWMNGRTDGYRPITVRTNADIGSIMSVRVSGARGHWLEGEPVHAEATVQA